MSGNNVVFMYSVVFSVYLKCCVQHILVHILGDTAVIISISL